MNLATRSLQRSIPRSLVMIGCLLLAGGTHAQDARTYLGARIGHITLEEVDDDGGFNVGALGGVFFGQGFSAEASLDFQESDFPIDVAGVQVGTPMLERKTIAVQIGLTFTPFPAKTVRPYGLGGIGHYFSEYASGGSYRDERVSELGSYAGAGIDFMGESWRDTVSVTIDVRWIFTGNEELPGSEVRSDGRMFSAGFRYKF